MSLSRAGSSGSSRRIPKIIVSKFGSFSSRSSSIAHSPTPVSTPRGSTLSLNDLNSERYLKVPRSPSFDVGVGLPSRRVSIDMGNSGGERMMGSSRNSGDGLERSCSLNILPTLSEEPHDTPEEDAPSNLCCLGQILHSLLRSWVFALVIVAFLIPIVLYFFYTLPFVPFTNSFNAMGQKDKIQASIHNLFIHSNVHHLTIEETTNSTLPTNLDYLLFATLLGH